MRTISRSFWWRRIAIACRSSRATCTPPTGARSTHCPTVRDLNEATLESKLLGKLELPNVFRPAARPGVAFAGDSALAADPLWGIGCGWAFQSADWLVQETAGSLDSGADQLDAALDRYRRVHRKRLLPHYMVISDIASGRPISAVERRIYRAAAKDSVLRETFERIGSRRAGPSGILRPGLLARIARPRAAAEPA